MYIRLNLSGLIPAKLKSGSCRCAIIGVPWCLRRLSLFSTFQEHVFDKHISGGRLCTLIGVPCRLSMLSTFSTFANLLF